MLRTCPAESVANGLVNGSERRAHAPRVTNARRLGTTALIEQRDSVRLEGGDGDRRRKTDGLARTFLHAGVLVHDAGHARNRNDDQECNDQDRDGALENRLRVCQAA